MRIVCHSQINVLGLMAEEARAIRHTLLVANGVNQDTQMKINQAVQHAHLRKRKIVTKKHVSNVHWEG